MKLDLCLAYLAEIEIVPIELPPRPIWVGEAVIAIASLETGIARIFSVFASSKEILKCLVKPSQDILQDMCGYILIFLSDFCLDFWQIVLLIGVADRLARILIGVFALREGRVVQFPAPGLRPVQLLLSLFRWIDTVLKRLAH